MLLQRLHSIIASLRSPVSGFTEVLRNFHASTLSIFTEIFPLRSFTLRNHAGLQPIPVKIHTRATRRGNSGDR